MADYPEFQKRFHEQNGTCIAYFAYAYKRRILEHKLYVKVAIVIVLIYVLGEGGGAQTPDTS